jgi:hypothetical protein
VTWDELVASALVGTARRAPALPAVAALGQVLDRIDRDDREGAVLKAGAALGLYRLAGARPSPHEGPPLPVAPAERRPVCSEASAAHLDAALRGDFGVVLGEWLQLAAAGQRLAPPDRLPLLLDAATTNATLRPAVTEVMGNRGRWLGELNPAWSWAAGAGEDPSIWATGSSAARRLLLARLRQTDPGAARELLASTWATESPEDRAAFVGALTTNLSMDDEPFLEDALDDRRKEVRRVAANLLWLLPGSRLAARMAARARPLVEASTLPTGFDAAMARDGMVERAPTGMGQRAWWLFQMVTAAPLQTWSTGMVQGAGTLLRQAWARAAVGQGDAAWAEALLPFDDVEEPALLEALPPERARAVATERVTRLGLTLPVLSALLHVPDPWGRELSTAVVQRLAEVVSQPRRDTAVHNLATDLALRLDPTVATAALAEVAVWAADVVGWMLDLLTFRADMREELRS